MQTTKVDPFHQSLNTVSGSNCSWIDRQRKWCLQCSSMESLWFVRRLVFSAWATILTLWWQEAKSMTWKASTVSWATSKGRISRVCPSSSRLRPQPKVKMIAENLSIQRKSLTLKCNWSVIFKLNQSSWMELNCAKTIAPRASVYGRAAISKLTSSTLRQKKVSLSSIPSHPWTSRLTSITWQYRSLCKSPTNSMSV